MREEVEASRINSRRRCRTEGPGRHCVPSTRAAPGRPDDGGPGLRAVAGVGSRLLWAGVGGWLLWSLLGLGRRGWAGWWGLPYLRALAVGGVALLGYWSL